MPELNMRALALKIGLFNVRVGTTVTITVGSWSEQKKAYINQLWFDIPPMYEERILVTLLHDDYLQEMIEIDRAKFERRQQQKTVDQTHINEAILDWTS